MFKKPNISRNALELSLLFGFLCAVFLSFADFDASCETLRHNCLRLHIIANSDSEADQELKLKIRDAILETSGELFTNNTDLESAKKEVETNLKNFELIANRVIKENDFNYTASVNLGVTFFENREYENFTLPAGNYESLIINIGKARGKNWWCVIFPQVCVPTNNTAKLSDSVTKSGVQIAENSADYEIRFKTVEIYEKIKRFFE